MKIYLKPNGQVVNVEDTEFTSNSVGNFVRYYFVDDNGAVVDNPEISFVNISFKREDGFVVANRMAEKNQTELYWEYVITETDGVLYRRGALLISAQFVAATYDYDNPYYEPIVADTTTAGTYYVRGTEGNYIFTAVTLPAGFVDGTTYYARYYNITARRIIATATQPAHVVYNIGIADVDELDAAFRAERLARENLAGLITKNGVDIEQNTADIEELQDLTAENAADIEELQDLTAEHTPAIAQNTADIEELQTAVSEADEKFRRKDDSYSAAQTDLIFRRKDDSYSVAQTDLIFRRKDDSVSAATYTAEQGVQNNRLDQAEAAIGTADITPIAGDIKAAIVSMNEDIDTLQLGVVPRIIRAQIEYPAPAVTPSPALIALLNAAVLTETGREPNNTDAVTVLDNETPDEGEYWTYNYWALNHEEPSIMDGWYLGYKYRAPFVTEILPYNASILATSWSETPDGEGLYIITIPAAQHGMGTTAEIRIELRRIDGGERYPLSLFTVAANGDITLYTDVKYVGEITVYNASYFLIPESSVPAARVEYNNVASGLSGDTAQEAIDELTATKLGKTETATTALTAETATTALTAETATTALTAETATTAGHAATAGRAFANLSIPQDNVTVIHYYAEGGEAILPFGCGFGIVAPVVDWGDGTVEEISIPSGGGVAFEAAHTYAAAATYEIRTSGAFWGFWWNNRADGARVKYAQLGTNVSSNLANAEMFEGCSNLAAAVLPSTLSRVPISMFSGCHSLTSIKIPASVTVIDGAAFENCLALRFVEIPYKATPISVADEAFFNVRLADLLVTGLGADGQVEAEAVRDAIVGAGATLMSGFRLLY